MSRLRDACLLMFYLTVAFIAYRNERLPWAVLPIWHIADVLIYFSCGQLVLTASVIDAKVRRHPLSDGAKLVMFTTGPVSLAVYLIWSRGWRGVLWLAVNLIVFVAVCFLAVSFANAVTNWQLAPSVVE